MASTKYVLPGKTLEKDPDFAPHRAMIAENYMEEFSIPFHVDSVADMDNILPRMDQDDGHSTAQIRVIDKIIPENVERMVLDLEHGDLFPGIGLNHVRGTNTFTVIWGNNRYASHAKAGRTTIAAYIVNVSQDVAQKLAEVEQTSGPQPLSSADIEALIMRHLADGMTHTEIADRLHVKPGAVSTVAAKNRAAIRLSSVGHDVTKPPYKRIVSSAKKSMALDSIYDNTVYAKAAEVAAETAMTEPEIRKLAEDLKLIRHAPDELVHIDTIKTSRMKDVQRQSMNIKPPPAIQIRKHVSAILDFTAEQLVTGLDDLERAHLLDDMTALFDLASDVIRRMGTSEMAKVVTANDENGEHHVARRRTTKKATASVA